MQMEYSNVVVVSCLLLLEVRPLLLLALIKTVQEIPVRPPEAGLTMVTGLWKSAMSDECNGSVS
jgi:hypothetical protein